MKRVFVEFPGFAKNIKTHRISEQAIMNLQNDIMAGKGDMIQNTGGLKKIRFGTETRGKSGAYRAIFVDYSEYGVTIVLEIFAKNEKANLKKDEINDFRQFKKLLDKFMRERYGKKT
jgi:hypothetical protein